MPDCKWNILSTKKIPAPIQQSAGREKCCITDLDFIVTESIIHPAIAAQIQSIQAPIVFTSSNAVKAFVANLACYELAPPPVPVFCLMEGSLRAAQKLGLPVAATAANATQLADKIQQHQPAITEVYFLCGNLRRNELIYRLHLHNIAVHEIIAYHTRLQPQTVQQNYDGILFFSPSSIDSFLSANQLKTEIPCFCIGPTTAQHLAMRVNNPIIVSPLPGTQQLVATAVDYFNVHKGYNAI